MNGYTKKMVSFLTSQAGKYFQTSMSDSNLTLKRLLDDLFDKDLKVEVTLPVPYLRHVAASGRSPEAPRQSSGTTTATSGGR